MANGPATLNELFLQHADTWSHVDAFTGFSSSRRTVSYSTAGFVSATFALSDYLLRSGLATGARVGILSENRPEWHIGDFSCLLARLVSVPVYSTLSPAQIRYILEHSGCEALIFSAVHRGIAEELKRQLPSLRTLIALDGAAAEGVVAFADIVRMPGADRPALRRECVKARPDDLATVVYTSGTTAAPKGVMLTHGNICFDLRQCLERLGLSSARQALSVLPLSHVFERLLTYGYIHMGIPVAYGDPHDLRGLLQQVRPDVMGCVPRILEKVKENIDAEIGRAPRLKQHIARYLIRSSLDHARQSRKPWAAADALVWRRVRSQLPDLKYLITGGAWLDPELEVFFRAAGFHLLQGYGLTETAPVISLNGFGDWAIGTTGKPLDGVEVRIAQNAEILVRGDNVMKGYFNDPAGTSAAVDSDGWLHTGDLGRLDPHGRLVVTGRIKELIVLSTGKNVSCNLVEQALCRSEWVQNAFVFGNGRKFITAVLVPSSRALGNRSFAEAIGQTDFYDRYTAEIARASESLSDYECVKRFRLIAPDDLENAEILTPTQKLRRSIFEQKYAGLIEEMYQQAAATGSPQRPYQVPALLQ